MNKILYLLVLLFSFPSFSQGHSKKKQVDISQKAVTTEQPVSILFAVDNEHDEKDSLKVELITATNSRILLHKGSFDGWGMELLDQQVEAGTYTLLISWYEDGQSKKTKREVIIQPGTEYISFNIELANEPGMNRTHNGIYVDHYTGRNLDSVEFKRNWIPREQFMKDSLLIPDYTVYNHNDSTVYGAYTRMSSSLSINWVQPHSIAFMRFEQKTDSGWVGIPCNAPRIEMKLKKGETGKTLTDMVLGGNKKYFQPGQLYRIEIDYMLSDRLYEKNPASDGFDDNVYVEQTIYSFKDEFKLE